MHAWHVCIRVLYSEFLIQITHCVDSCTIRTNFHELVRKSFIWSGSIFCSDESASIFFCDGYEQTSKKLVLII